MLDTDPSKTSICKYLNDSDVYGLQVDENIVSLAVILHIDKNTLELKNLVTKKEYRGNGYAKKLLKSLCGNYKQKYNKMLVGTSENNIPFYVKQGFDKYEKTNIIFITEQLLLKEIKEPYYPINDEKIILYIINTKN